MKQKAENLDIIACEIRKCIVKMHCASNSSHVGSALSCVDILVSLYFNVLNIRPKMPKFPDRDRFILSKGHAASALYATLAHRGFFKKGILNGYCIDGGTLPGHCTKDVVPGIEASTGSLGHGLPIGAGMALSAKHDKKDFKTFVLLSDGECDEGSVWEAAMFASQHKLDNLIAIIDYNKIQAFGRTKDIIDLEPFTDKWRSFGWKVTEINGHDINKVIDALKRVPFASGKPSVIIAHTTKGKGVSFMEDELLWHYKSPCKEDAEKAFKELNK